MGKSFPTQVYPRLANLGSTAFDLVTREDQCMEKLPIAWAFHYNASSGDSVDNGLGKITLILDFKR